MDYGYMPSHAAPADIPEDFKANAGEPLADGVKVASEEEVIEAMRTVYDPEIPVNIFDLGLIVKYEISDIGAVNVDMTLTAPGCPVAGDLPGWVADAIAKAEGVGEVVVALVWDPPWTPELMSEDAKLALGMF